MNFFTFLLLCALGEKNSYDIFLSSIYILSVRLYALNVKTAEPIGPKFCGGLHMSFGKVYGTSKFEEKSFFKWPTFRATVKS